MADQVNGGAPQSGGDAQDPIQNLKGEFNRKLSGLDEQVKSLSEHTKTLLSKLDGLTKPAPAPTKDESEDLSEVMFSRPGEFIKRFKDEVRNVVGSELSNFQQSSAQTSQTLSSLYDQYPDLANPSSELTKKALENLSSMTKEEQRNPKMLKVAALEAAADLGVQPRKHRSKEDSEPDVAFNATRGMYAPDKDLPRSLKAAEQSMTELAARMGVDVNNKDVMARMRAKLKNMAK